MGLGSAIIKAMHDSWAGVALNFLLNPPPVNVSPYPSNVSGVGPLGQPATMSAPQSSPTTMRGVTPQESEALAKEAWLNQNLRDPESWKMGIMPLGPGDIQGSLGFASGLRRNLPALASEIKNLGPGVFSAEGLGRLKDLLRLPSLSAGGSQATIPEMIRAGAAEHMEPADIAQRTTKEYLAHPKKNAPGYENPYHVFKPGPKSPPDAPPQYVVGKPTNPDLTRLVTNSMSIPEINQAAKWWPEFVARVEANVAPEDVKPFLNAWILSQRGDSPARGIANTLIEERRILLGTQAEEKLGGTGYEDLSSIFMGTLPKKGISRKIADMGDVLRKYLSTSLFGEQAGGPPRTMFPEFTTGSGSIPVPGDRHMARANGYVDERVATWLKKNYPDDPMVKKLSNDMVAAGSVPDALYEPTAQKIRELTDYWNKIKFMDKTDWTADKVQPVVWTAYRKSIGLSSGTPEEAFAYNMAQSPMEAAPGDGSPWSKLLPNPLALPTDRARAFTNKFNAKIINETSGMLGVRPLDLLETEGGWKPPGKELVVNPNTTVTMMGTPTALQDARDAVSYLGNQTSNPLVKVPYSGDPANLPTQFSNKAELRNYLIGSRANSTGIRISSPLFGDRKVVKDFGTKLYGFHPNVGGHTLIADEGNPKLFLVTTDPKTGMPVQLSARGLKDIETAIGKVMDDLKMPDGSVSTEWMGTEYLPNYNDWTQFPAGEKHLEGIKQHAPDVAEKLQKMAKDSLPKWIKEIYDEVAPGFWDTHFKAQPFNKTAWDKMWEPGVLPTTEPGPIPPSARPKQPGLFGSPETITAPTAPKTAPKATAPGPAIKAPEPESPLLPPVNPSAPIDLTGIKEAPPITPAPPGKTAWRTTVAKVKEVKPKNLGTVIEPEDMTRGWVFPSGKTVQVDETHPVSLADFFKISKKTAQANYPEIADKFGLVRMMLRPKSQQPILELFSAPTDPQLRSLLRLEKAYQSPVEFYINDPTTQTLLGQGTGVNQIRRVLGTALKNK